MIIRKFLLLVLAVSVFGEVAMATGMMELRHALRELNEDDVRELIQKIDLSGVGYKPTPPGRFDQMGNHYLGLLPYVIDGLEHHKDTKAALRIVRLLCDSGYDLRDPAYAEEGRWFTNIQSNLECIEGAASLDPEAKEEMKALIRELQSQAG